MSHMEGYWMSYSYMKLAIFKICIFFYGSTYKFLALCLVGGWGPSIDECCTWKKGICYRSRNFRFTGSLAIHISPVLINQEVEVEIEISKSKDFPCFGAFSAVLGATNDDFCPRTIVRGLTPLVQVRYAYCGSRRFSVVWCETSRYRLKVY